MVHSRSSRRKVVRTGTNVVLSFTVSFAARKERKCNVRMWVHVTARMRDNLVVSLLNNLQPRGYGEGDLRMACGGFILHREVTTSLFFHNRTAIPDGNPRVPLS